MTKTVVITGTSRGIGRALAENYVKQGWTVFATARILSTIESTLPPNAKKHSLDVTSETSIASFVEAIGSKTPVHLLINNAGTLPPPKPFESIGKQEMMDAFEVNAVGPVLVTQALYENLKLGAAVAAGGNGVGGVVANLSSILASIEKNMTGSYHACRASKAANNSFSKSLAFDLKPNGISILQFHPGYVKTDMSPQGIVSPQRSAEGIAKVIDQAFTDTAFNMTGQFFDFQGKKLPW
ncbi:hypothetical protein HK100_007769 [Physocladia obscura]|uniref:Uncharacterized protein n=1 Tax=Physocladia obscura TaxID=109957 RepID=A0AAD5T5I5_9FUNG|nr:hypothetical protein HK100_007769 [Physocladia obscura]